MKDDKEDLKGETIGNKTKNHKNTDLIENEDVFGFKNLLYCIAAASVRTTAVWNMISVVFILPPTEFTCTEFEGNETRIVENSTCYKDCVQYNYKSTIYEHTLIAEFNLICDNAWLASLSQSILMFGFLLGITILGWMADRFGRRIVLLVSEFVNVTLMIMVPFSPNLWIYIVLRFFIGLASGGTLMISVVYVLESVPQKYRELAGYCALLPDGVAQVLLSLFAYLAKSWRMFLLQYAILSIMPFVPIFFIPETPRWLALKTKKEEYSQLMLKTNVSKNTDEKVYEVEQIELPHDKSNKKSYLDLFRTKELALKTIISFFIWIVCGITIFCMNQNTSSVGSNIYIAFAVLGLAMAPVNYLGMMCNKKFGRKNTVMCGLIMIGLCVGALMFTPNGHWSSTVFFITGLSTLCLSFSVLYVYVSELYPTAVRSMAYGVCGIGNKLGGMIAPFLAILTPSWLPFMILTILVVAATISCLFLPETKGKKLDDTL